MTRGHVVQLKIEKNEYNILLHTSIVLPSSVLTLAVSSGAVIFALHCVKP